MIQTGVERLYSDYTSFVFKAKRDGKVIYLDENIVCVQYDNKTCDAFYVGYRKLYISTVDFYKVYYNIGNTFFAGDIIAESNYLKSGNITLGKNCLVCIMPWYGYNYEDGVIVSEKIVNDDYFTSVHYIDYIIELTPNKVLLNLNDEYSNYKPLPGIGDLIQKGEVFAKLKSINTDGFDDVIFEPIHEEQATENCKIVDVKIYANKWNKSFPQFDQFIQKLVKTQKDKKYEIVKKLSNYLTKDELDNLTGLLEIHQTEKNNFKIKGDYIDGIRIEITAVFERKLTVGDKLGNRHGNKGTISKIVKEENLPVLPDGRKPDIILNPLGIISRMNVGQVFEAHLTMAFSNLKNQIRHMYDEKKTQEEIYKYILDFIDIIDKTDGKYYLDQMKSFLDQISIHQFVNKCLHQFYLIQPPFESIRWTDLDKAMKYTNTEYEFKIYDPISKSYIQDTIACGFMYFMKLNHIAQDKMSYRGIGPYSAKTSQPLGGKSRKGGQRLGEMEIWAVIGHGAEKNLNEFISTKSDSIKLRNKYISEMMGNTDLLLESDDDEVPQSLRLLQTNLKAIGLDYELYEGFDKLGVDIVEEDEEEPIDIEEIPISDDSEEASLVDSDDIDDFEIVSDVETVKIPISDKIDPSKILNMGPSFGDSKITYDTSLDEGEEINE